MIHFVAGSYVCTLCRDDLYVAERTTGVRLGTVKFSPVLSDAEEASNGKLAAAIVGRGKIFGAKLCRRRADLVKCLRWRTPEDANTLALSGVSRSRVFLRDLRLCRVVSARGERVLRSRRTLRAPNLPGLSLRLASRGVEIRRVGR